MCKAEAQAWNLAGSFCFCPLYLIIGFPRSRKWSNARSLLRVLGLGSSCCCTPRDCLQHCYRWVVAASILSNHGLAALGKTLPFEASVCIGTTQEFTKRFVHPAKEKDPEATRQLMKRFSGQSARAHEQTNWAQVGRDIMAHVPPADIELPG